MSLASAQAIQTGNEKFARLCKAGGYEQLNQYVNTTTKVKLKCSLHNTVVWALPKSCFSYNRILGCKQCQNKRLTVESQKNFLDLCNNRYKLLESYKRSDEKIKLKCLKHNTIFYTLPHGCIQNNRIIGCKDCGSLRCSKAAKRNKKFDTAKSKFITLLGNNYIILGRYKASYNKTKMFCNKHQRVFYTIPRSSVKYNRIVGCKYCTGTFSLTRNKFINLLTNKFDLIEDYSGRRKTITAFCKKHKQNFKISVDSSLRYGYIAGCSKCKSISGGERELLFFVEKLLGKENICHQMILRDTDNRIIKPDILIPKLKIIIEWNGVYWHSAITGSEKDDKWRHHNRRERLEILGYRVIQVWEDDWIKRKPVIKRYLKAQLCGNRLSVWNARKLLVKWPSNIFANRFMNKYHPQGQSYGKHDWISLFDPETKQTVAIMGFSSTTRTVRNKSNTVELTRYASKGRVRGGASRLLAHYLRENLNTKQVISFSDNDYFDGRMYEAIGFKYDGEVKPDYMTIWSGQRRHKSYTKRTNLERMAKYKRIIFYPNWSEADCLFFNNIRRCWNSGKKRWIFHYQYVSNRQK